MFACTIGGFLQIASLAHKLDAAVIRRTALFLFLVSDHSDCLYINMIFTEAQEFHGCGVEAWTLDLNEGEIQACRAVKTSVANKR